MLVLHLQSQTLCSPLLNRSNLCSRSIRDEITAHSSQMVLQRVCTTSAAKGSQLRVSNHRHTETLCSITFYLIISFHYETVIVELLGFNQSPPHYVMEGKKKRSNAFYYFSRLLQYFLYHLTKRKILKSYLNFLSSF